MILEFLQELLGYPLDQLPAASHADSLDENTALRKRRVLRLTCSCSGCTSPAINHMLIFVGTCDDEPETVHWAELCAHHNRRMLAWVDRHRHLLNHEQRPLYEAEG